MNKSIENKVIQTTEDSFLKELKEISTQYKVLQVDIDGIEIQTWKDFAEIIEKNFNFQQLVKIVWIGIWTGLEI